MTQGNMTIVPPDAATDTNEERCAAAPAYPLLSVTVLNYNYGRYLNQCLDSILGQTMRDFELILINDCSTDNSMDVIAPYLADPRVRLVNHEVNQGFVKSLIEGSELSRGRYITVISADDYALDMRAFEIGCKTLETDEEIVFFYSASNRVDDAGTFLCLRGNRCPDYVAAGGEELHRLLSSSPVLHSGALIRRTAYASVGGYDSSQQYSVDTNMWLMLCTVGKVAYNSKSMFAYRAHAANLSTSAGAMWTSTAEWLSGIDAALARFPGLTDSTRQSLRKKAWQHALVAIATDDIFSGRVRRGWIGFWISFKHYPLLTLLQGRIISLAFQTMFGPRGFAVLQRSRQMVTSIFFRGHAASVPAFANSESQIT